MVCLLMVTLRVAIECRFGDECVRGAVGKGEGGAKGEREVPEGNEPLWNGRGAQVVIGVGGRGAKGGLFAARSNGGVGFSVHHRHTSSCFLRGDCYPSSSNEATPYIIAHLAVGDNRQVGFTAEVAEKG